MTFAGVVSVTPLIATNPVPVIVHLLPAVSTIAAADPALTTVSLAEGVGFGVAVGAGVGFGVAVGAGVGLGVTVGVGVGVGGSGLVEVPLVGDQAADGLALLHHRSDAFSCQTNPLT